MPTAPIPCLHHSTLCLSGGRLAEGEGGLFVTSDSPEILAYVLSIAGSLAKCNSFDQGEFEMVSVDEPAAGVVRAAARKRLGITTTTDTEATVC